MAGLACSRAGYSRCQCGHPSTGANSANMEELAFTRIFTPTGPGALCGGRADCEFADPTTGGDCLSKPGARRGSSRACTTTSSGCTRSPTRSRVSAHGNLVERGGRPGGTPTAAPTATPGAQRCRRSPFIMKSSQGAGSADPMNGDRCSGVWRTTAPEARPCSTGRPSHSSRENRTRRGSSHDSGYDSDHDSGRDSPASPPCEGGIVTLNTLVTLPGTPPQSPAPSAMGELPAPLPEGEEVRAVIRLRLRGRNE